MDDKVCTVCKKRKPLEDFCRETGIKCGRKSSCRDCNKIKQKKYGATESGKEANRKYRNSEKGKKTIAEYKNSEKGKKKLDEYCRSEKCKNKDRRYNTSEKGKAYRNKKSKEEANKHPEKYRARYKAASALKSGKIKRAPCEVCGNNKAEMHHDDYSKPLDIRWLCKKHHVEFHRKKVEKENR